MSSSSVASEIRNAGGIGGNGQPIGQTNVNTTKKSSRVQTYVNGEKVSDTDRVLTTVNGEQKWVQPERLVTTEQNRAAQGIKSTPEQRVQAYEMVKAKQQAQIVQQQEQQRQQQQANEKGMNELSQVNTMGSLIIQDMTKPKQSIVFNKNAQGTNQHWIENQPNDYHGMMQRTEQTKPQYKVDYIPTANDTVTPSWINKNNNDFLQSQDILKKGKNTDLMPLPSELKGIKQQSGQFINPDVYTKATGVYLFSETVETGKNLYKSVRHPVQTFESTVLAPVEYVFDPEFRQETNQYLSVHLPSFVATSYILGKGIEFGGTKLIEYKASKLGINYYAMELNVFQTENMPTKAANLGITRIEGRAKVSIGKQFYDVNYLSSRDVYIFAKENTIQDVLGQPERTIMVKAGQGFSSGEALIKITGKKGSSTYYQDRTGFFVDERGLIATQETNIKTSDVSQSLSFVKFQELEPSPNDIGRTLTSIKTRGSSFNDFIYSSEKTAKIESITYTESGVSFDKFISLKGSVSESEIVKGLTKPRTREQIKIENLDITSGFDKGYELISKLKTRGKAQLNSGKEPLILEQTAKNLVKQQYITEQVSIFKNSLPSLITSFKPLVTTQKNKPLTIQRLQYFQTTKTEQVPIMSLSQSLASNQKQSQDNILSFRKQPITQQKQSLNQMQDLSQSQVQKQIQLTEQRQVQIPELTMRQTNMQRTVQNPVLTKLPNFLFFGVPNSQQNQNTNQAYDVYIKRKQYKEGKKKYLGRGYYKANKQPLTQESALSLGGEIVDEYANRSFRIKKTTGHPQQTSSSWGFISQKFRFSKKNPSVFVEKSKYAIDSPEERNAIPYEAARQKRQKRWF